MKDGCGAFATLDLHVSADHHAALRTILSADPERLRLLQLVGSLSLPDCWIGAGFVRDAVWDHLHGRPPGRPSDIDVVWFDPSRPGPWVDRQLEAKLGNSEQTFDWDVKNQSRMHSRNGDRPYASTLDAIRHWPETATAVAVRGTPPGGLELAAPFGFDDLFGLVVRPTPRFRAEKHHVYLDRLRTKAWLSRWPLLRAAE